MSCMMRLFVDTNILLDSLARRKPFEEAADKLFMLGYLREFELWISPSQCTDVFYILTTGSSKTTPDAAKGAMKRLLSFFNVCNLTRNELESALESLEEDFEDALLSQCAKKMSVDAIVTRDKTGFRHGAIPAMDCEELFQSLSDKGFVYDVLDL